MIKYLDVQILKKNIENALTAFELGKSQKSCTKFMRTSWNNLEVESHEASSVDGWINNQQPTL